MSVCPRCLKPCPSLDPGFCCPTCERQVAANRRTLAEVVESVPFDPALARLLEQKKRPAQGRSLDGRRLVGMPLESAYPVQYYQISTKGSRMLTSKASSQPPRAGGIGRGNR